MWVVCSWIVCGRLCPWLILCCFCSVCGGVDGFDWWCEVDELKFPGESYL